MLRGTKGISLSLCLQRFLFSLSWKHSSNIQHYLSSFVFPSQANKSMHTRSRKFSFAYKKIARIKNVYHRAQESRAGSREEVKDHLQFFFIYSLIP